MVTNLGHAISLQQTTLEMTETQVRSKKILGGEYKFWRLAVFEREHGNSALHALGQQIPHAGVLEVRELLREQHVARRELHQTEPKALDHRLTEAGLCLLFHKARYVV